MALQTGAKNHLEANGIQVQVEKRCQDQLTVYHQGKVGAACGIKEKVKGLYPSRSRWAVSLVLSGGVLVFQGLTKLLHAELDTKAHQKAGRMDTFFSNNCRRVELDRSHFEKSSGQSYHLVQDQNQLLLGQSKGDDIRKQMMGAGGYQPYDFRCSL